MLGEKKFLAIIPARGGSKRLPGKNVRSLAGKPLIAWTIEAALKSKHIDKVLVTSDDDEILKVAEEYGAMKIKRPAQFAQDNSVSFDAVKHVIESTEPFFYTVLLQPTSPLRTSQHIDEAIQLLSKRKADGVISVTEIEHSAQWANVLPKGDSMVNFLEEENLNKRSQDLESHYRLNGAIYIAKTSILLQIGSFFLKSNIYAYRMSSLSSVDVDTEIDFKWAEFLYASKSEE